MLKIEGLRLSVDNFFDWGSKIFLYISFKQISMLVKKLVLVLWRGRPNQIF